MFDGVRDRASISWKDSLTFEFILLGKHEAKVKFSVDLGVFIDS